MKTLSTVLALGVLFSAPHASYAATVRSIPMEAAKGNSGAIPTLNIWTEAGLNINFIPTGEVIKKVWLDDISRIGIDFDGKLCEAQEGCETTGASVIHLRRITPIDFPGLPKTKTTLLSIVTESKKGEKSLYQFQIAYGTGTPEYVSINVVPKPPASPIANLRVPVAPVSMPRPTLVVQEEPTGGERTLSSLNVPDATPPSTATPSIEEQALLVERGLLVAQEQTLISKERGNHYLIRRVERYLSFLRSGESRARSAEKARIPLHFVETLEQLGQPKS